MEFPFYRPPHVTQHEWLDRQWGAALFVFHSMRNPDIERACFDHVGPGIDKAGLLELASSWARSEYLMIRLALDLFDPGCVVEHGHRPPAVGECVEVLDEENLARLRMALAIATGELTAVEALQQLDS